MRKLLNKLLKSYGYYHESVPQVSNFEPSTPKIKDGTLRDAYAMALKGQAMRIPEFRSSPVRIDSAKEMFLNPIFSDMYWAVSNEKPTGFKEAAAPTDIQAAMMLGRIQGYETAMLNWYLLCAEPVKPPKPIIATYGAKEEPDNNKPEK